MCVKWYSLFLRGGWFKSIHNHVPIGCVCRSYNTVLRAFHIICTQLNEELYQLHITLFIAQHFVMILRFLHHVPGTQYEGGSYCLHYNMVIIAFWCIFPICFDLLPLLMQPLLRIYYDLIFIIFI